MGLKNRLDALRLFPKLLLTFLLVLSPLYAVGILMNESGLSNIKSEISDSLSSRGSLYMEMLDNDLFRVYQLLRQYVNDEDLQNLSVKAEIMTDFDRTQATLRLKRRLDLLKQSSAFVENVSVMIPLMNRTISSNDDAVSNLDRVQFEALRDSPNRLASPFMMWGDRIFISMAYPDSSTKRPPVFLLLIEISRAELQSALARFTTAGGSAVLADASRNWAVTGQADASGAGAGTGAGRVAGTGVGNGAAAANDAGEALGAIAEEAAVQRAPSGAVVNVEVGKRAFMVVRQDSGRFGMSLTMVVPSERVNAPAQSYRKWLILLSLVSVAIVVLFSLGIYRMIHRPLRSLLYSFRRIEKGQLNQTAEYPFRDEFGYLFERFNAMVRQLNVMVHEVYEQQYRARWAELRHLQSQINPHFLYNTYYVLYRMAKREDTDNVMRLTQHLGDYFQYMTRDAADEVPLEKEAGHARTYLEIQSIRFAGRIETSFGELPPGAGALPVPRLLLQPIIENAFNHALEKMPRGGWLQVDIGLTQKALRIVVEDNGPEMTPAKLDELRLALRTQDDVRESTGMINVHRRLQIKYGDEAGLRLDIGARGGLRVEIVIPRMEGNAS